jgi:16S rRNA A1518/A1519 N6-dimethyltransferase RsmA/KsgA/DIM1 with predicted DNA glycosylase/AP lyase activity
MIPKVKYIDRLQTEMTLQDSKKDHEVELLSKFIMEQIGSQDATIIDVGCGKGYLTLELIEKMKGR